MIGAGEIFAVSAAYEVAFTASPPEKKVLASALNLFCVGGIPNVLCIVLYQAAKGWFRNGRGTASISKVEDYVTARVDNYFFVLLIVAIVAIVMNLLSGLTGELQNLVAYSSIDYWSRLSLLRQLLMKISKVVTTIYSSKWS